MRECDEVSVIIRRSMYNLLQVLAAPAESNVHPRITPA